MEARKAAAVVGQTLHQRYRLERLLGAGGMGAVYAASDLQDPSGGQVAVKILDAEVAEAPETRGRFRREARISAELDHPNAVAIHDFAEDEDGTLYLVMELLEGKDLQWTLLDEGPLDAARAVGIARQVASALAVGHGRGIIHRDLKPPNIFMVAGAQLPADTAKILDFGVSKIVGSKSVLTRTTAKMGTPSYMSPEQAEGRSSEVDARSDVYALGAIVYEMLAGRAPFVGESVPAVLYKVIHQDPPALSILGGGALQAALERVIFRALAKRPEERFDSVGELVEALEDALIKAQVAPLPGPEIVIGPAARGGPASGGQRALLVVAVGLGVLLTVGLGVAVLLSVR